MNPLLATLLGYFGVALYCGCLALSLVAAFWPLKRSMTLVLAALVLTYTAMYAFATWNLNRPGVDGPGVIGAALLLFLPPLLFATCLALRVCAAVLRWVAAFLLGTARQRPG